MINFNFPGDFTLKIFHREDVPEMREIGYQRVILEVGVREGGVPPWSILFWSLKVYRRRSFSSGPEYYDDYGFYVDTPLASSGVFLKLGDAFGAFRPRIHFTFTPWWPAGREGTK